MYTGVAELIWVVIWGYIGLAAISFAVALRKPQSLSAKLAWASVVLVVFGYLPVSSELRSRRNKSRSDDLRVLVAQSCSAQRVTPLTEAVEELHIASSALTSDVGLGKAYHYMLGRGLKTLEFDASIEAAGRFAQLSNYGKLATQGAASSGRTIALSLSHRDDSTCAMFNRWSHEDPAQKLPALRKLGLRPDACIGASLLDAPSSKLFVTATSRPLGGGQEPRTRASEYTFTATDLSTGRVLASATATLVPADGKMRDACVNGEAQRSSWDRNWITLDALVPERRPFAPEITTTDEPPEFPVQRQASAEDILQSRAMRGAGKVWSTNIIDYDGTTWIEHKYVSGSSGSLSHYGYYLVSLRGSRLYKTFIRLGETRVGDATGLLATEDEIRLVGLDRHRELRWLLVYSGTGKPLAALALTDEQFTQLGDDTSK